MSFRGIKTAALAEHPLEQEAITEAVIKITVIKDQDHIRISQDVGTWCCKRP